MKISDHPSIEELRKAMQERGTTLACTVCGREEFTLEETSLRDTGGGQYFGNVRRNRSQIVCENCGHVMSFEVEKLQGSRS